mmetsp:Transcript_33175/g.84211  ORF Transcript_33175/g.84211 Transcript_33175/m.84211 type:complete len:375 (-) Transcript_33175:566-1690(-)
MGSSTLSNTRFQKDSANVAPWNLSTSNSTSSALLRISGRGSNVSSDRPASSGNQKYTCSSRSTKRSDDGAPPPAAPSSAWAAAAACVMCVGMRVTLPGRPSGLPMLCLMLATRSSADEGPEPAPEAERARAAATASLARLRSASTAAAAASALTLLWDCASAACATWSDAERMGPDREGAGPSADDPGAPALSEPCAASDGCAEMPAAPALPPDTALSSATTRSGWWCAMACDVSAPSGSASTSPIAPSASFMAQKRRNAILLSATSSECGLLVNAMRQLTQSVNVVVSVSVMWLKCSRTIFSIVSNARRTIMGSLSPAAVVNTMSMDFQPDLTLFTRASTIWLRQRMMSSRISTAWLWRMTTTKGRRKSFWNV